MGFSNDKKYVKYELNYSQKQKLIKLAGQIDSNPDTIVNKIEQFLDEFSHSINLDSWQKILTFLNLKLLEEKAREKADEIIETKKKIKIQTRLQDEYEDDYMAFIALGEALDSMNKI